MPYKCAACGDEASKICQGCRLVSYCGRDCQQYHWRDGHKNLCSKLPKAVQKAEARIDNFSLGQYDVRPTAPFMVTEAVTQRGEIQEEGYAQDLCYDAMEMEPGSTVKLLRSLEALRAFPLSTEAWGMLGHYFEFELKVDEDLQVNMYTKALKMYDNGIKCARMLNPSWTADRDAELSYGVIEHRPYYRALAGRARALQHLGRTKEAIAQAKKIMKWNPSDNQGLRSSLVNWFLEVGDTESCTNLLRKYDASDGAHLAYADLVLQYLRWKKDDASEKDVKRALYIAIKTNPHVPELIISLDRPSDDDSTASGYSPGEESEAEYYMKDSRSLWENQQDLIEWIKAAKTLGGQRVPRHESDVIELLKSGHTFQMNCAHTDLDGAGSETSDVIGTQRRDKCRGCGLESFKYPRQLNRTHVDGGDIIFFNNDEICDWRKTKFEDIHCIPFWSILIQFYDEDIDPVREINQERPRTSRTQTYGSQRPFVLDCKECGKPGRFCALDSDETAFYCSEECMADFLEEVEPHYIDIQSEVLKVKAYGESSVKTLNLDDAFRVATEHMPNLKGVDIYINQQYFLNDSMYCGEDGKREIILSAPVMKNFFERKKHELVGISLCLDQCIEEKFKERTDRAKALVAIGSMPNLKKLVLSYVGFDDVDTLTRCIGPDLESLRLANVKIGSGAYGYEWQSSDVDELIRKLSQIRNLRTLCLDDIALSPRNLQTLAPRLSQVRDLSLEGAFGGQGGSITDASLALIADSCPNLLSLDVSYQRGITFAGLKHILQRISLVDLEASDIRLSTHQVANLVGNSSLKFVRYSNAGNRWDNPGEQEQRIVREAVIRRNGEVVLCTDMGGLVKFTLPSALRANQEAAKNFVNEACEAGRDVLVTCKWDTVSAS